VKFLTCWQVCPKLLAKSIRDKLVPPTFYGVFMKFGLAMVLLFSSVAYAEPSVEEIKGKVLENINEQMSFLEKQKSCVSVAKTQDDLKKCREKQREHVTKRKQEMMGKRSEHLEAKQKKLDERKKKLNTKAK
jgi:hypothetical protein